MLSFVCPPGCQTTPLVWFTEISVLSPAQKEFAPELVMTGAALTGNKVVVITEEAALHPKLLVATTVKEPEVFTLMVGVLTPVFQMIPVPGVEVKITVSPLHRPSGPLAVIKGIVTGFTVTVVTTGEE